MTEYRVILGGASPAAGEVWSTGFSLQGVAPAMTQGDLNAWALGIANALEVLTTNNLIQLLSSTGNISNVRCELRDPATEALIRAGEATLSPVRAGSGTTSKVLQCAAVISLRTANPGRSFRGRQYWPAWAYTGTAEMLFPPSGIPTWLAAYADLVELINVQAIVVDPTFAVILVVRSRLLHVSTPVTSLAIGNVPDTQRRRRDAVNETYVVLPV